MCHLISSTPISSSFNSLRSSINPWNVKRIRSWSSQVANLCRILYLQISAGYYICKMYKFDFGQVCVKGPQHQDPKLLKIVTWEEWSVPLHNIFHVYTFDLRRILSILYYCGVDHYPLPWDNEIVMNIFGDLLFKNSQRHKLIEFIEKIFFSK